MPSAPTSTNAGIGHDVLHLYAAGHTTTGTPMDSWDWPERLDLRDLVDFDEQGHVRIDPAPFDQQRTGAPAQVITLRDNQPPRAAGVMRRGETASGINGAVGGAEIDLDAGPTAGLLWAAPG